MVLSGWNLSKGNIGHKNIFKYDWNARTAASGSAGYKQTDRNLFNGNIFLPRDPVIQTPPDAITAWFVTRDTNGVINTTAEAATVKAGLSATSEAVSSDQELSWAQLRPTTTEFPAPGSYELTWTDTNVQDYVPRTTVPATPEVLWAGNSVVYSDGLLLKLEKSKASDGEALWVIQSNAGDEITLAFSKSVTKAMLFKSPTHLWVVLFKVKAEGPVLEWWNTVPVNGLPASWSNDVSDTILPGSVDFLDKGLVFYPQSMQNAAANVDSRSQQLVSLLLKTTETGYLIVSRTLDVLGLDTLQDLTTLSAANSDTGSLESAYQLKFNRGFLMPPTSSLPSGWWIAGQAAQDQLPTSADSWAGLVAFLPLPMNLQNQFYQNSVVPGTLVTMQQGPLTNNPIAVGWWLPQVASLTDISVAPACAQRSAALKVIPDILVAAPLPSERTGLAIPPHPGVFQLTFDPDNPVQGAWACLSQMPALSIAQTTWHPMNDIVSELRAPLSNLLPQMGGRFEDPSVRLLSSLVDQQLNLWNIACPQTDYIQSDEMTPVTTGCWFLSYSEVDGDQSGAVEYLLWKWAHLTLAGTVGSSQKPVPIQRTLMSRVPQTAPNPWQVQMDDLQMTTFFAPLGADWKSQLLSSQWRICALPNSDAVSKQVPHQLDPDASQSIVVLASAGQGIIGQVQVMAEIPSEALDSVHSVVKLNYPTTKLERAQLKVVSPEPQLAQVSSAMFNPVARQVANSKTLPDGTEATVPAMKAIRYNPGTGNVIYVSVYAENTKSITYTDTTGLNPVLMDYEVTDLGQNSVQMLLVNDDYAQLLVIPVVQETT
jgi:hypothetical protein